MLDSSAAMSTADPHQVRVSASAALVNGFRPGARASVVDLDRGGVVAANLTDDKSALIAGLGSVDDSGDASLSAGLRAAIDVLALANAGRDRYIVVMTDGLSNYDEALTAEAATADIAIFTIGLGPSADADLLTAMAEDTGGRFSQAQDLVGPTLATQAQPNVGTDSDADGLSDCAEAQGAWDARGTRYVTDPERADTDGDGMNDGQEVTNDLASFDASAAHAILHLPLDIEAFRFVVSDPTASDSDADGAIDSLEFDVGTDPWQSDTDHDGLSDFAELDQHGTDPLHENTDGDQRNDGWEVSNTSAGFDPMVYDEEVSKWAYAQDFAAGAACPEGWSRCEEDSVAFLAGSIAGGFLAYKDVLDLIGNVSTLNFVGAGLAAAAFVPVGGDATSVVSKGVRFLRRVPVRKQLDGLAYIAKADKIPETVRMQLVSAYDPESTETLKKARMQDKQILALVRQRNDVRVLSDAIRNASRVQKSPRMYKYEREAQIDLAASVPDARTEAFFPCPACAPNSVLGSRRIDVYDPHARATIEVKNGFVRTTDHVRREIAKDVALLADPHTPIDSVRWEFFPRADGSVGPDDELRELLMTHKIPFTVHLP